MKKSLLCMLAFVASLSVHQADAQTLKTQADSVSYAAGVAVTDGLQSYLEKQFGVDKSQMPDVLRGVNDAMKQRNDKQFQAYEAGMQIASMLNKQMLPRMKQGFEGTENALNEEIVLQGFLAALNNDTTVYSLAAAKTKFTESMAQAKTEREENAKAEGAKFLAENKKQADVVTLPSGLQYKVLVAGKGAIPTADDQVEVVYEGRTIDGKVFDSTKKHNTATDVFQVNRLIKGWTEALQRMPVGSKWELYIPYDLAYGDRGAGSDIAPYSTLIFTMELKGIVEKQADATKKDEAKPAATQQTTKVTPSATAKKTGSRQVAAKKKR